MKACSAVTLLLLLALLNEGAAYCAPNPLARKEWEPLCKALAGWSFDTHFTFHVGNASGTQFVYSRGNDTQKEFVGMNTVLDMASSSKWLSASMIVGLVADGTIASFDTPINHYLPYWTKDPEDKRSRMTLRHLLTFTSGYLDATDKHGKDPFNPPCADNTTRGDFDRCTHELYDRANITDEPGTVWDYNSYHLQFAGAVATAAAGKPIGQLYEEYLFRPLGFTDSSGCTDVNPQIATCMRTTGEDYGRLLRAHLTYTTYGPPKHSRPIIEEMEKDGTAPPKVRPSDMYAWEAEWFGHFSMGHWFECLDNKENYEQTEHYALRPDCAKEDIHANPGAFGYYPLIDRSRNYYMQVVVQEQTDPLDFTGIPEYLRMAAKPYADAIMAGQDATLVSRSQLKALALEDVASLFASRDDGLASRERRRARPGP